MAKQIEIIRAIEAAKKTSICRAGESLRIDVKQDGTISVYPILTSEKIGNEVEDWFNAN